MSRWHRDVLIVVLVLAIAGAGYWAWQRFFSHGAQIQAMYRACLAEFDAGKQRVKAQIDKRAAAVPGNSTAAPLVEDVSAGLGKLLDRYASSVGDAACGTLRDACRLDFESDVCRKAREHFDPAR